MAAPLIAFENVVRTYGRGQAAVQGSRPRALTFSRCTGKGEFVAVTAPAVRANPPA